MNTPFDYITLGYMLRLFEEEGPFFDIDLAYDKLSAMGLNLTIDRIISTPVDIKDFIFSWIKGELEARSLDQPLSTSTEIDQLPNRRPSDFVALGMTVAELDADPKGTNAKRITLCSKLESMVLSCASLSKEVQVAMSGEQWLAFISNKLSDDGLNISFSSPESLRLALLDIMSIFTPGIWSAMTPGARTEYLNAEKLIKTGDFDSAAMHVCLAVEETFRSFFRYWCLTPDDLTLSWSDMETRLFAFVRTNPDQESNQRIKSATYCGKDFRISYRNPTMHGMRAEDAWSIKRLLSQSVEATTRFLEGVPSEHMIN
jgi:hypothetical protein